MWRCSDEISSNTTGDGHIIRNSSARHYSLLQQLHGILFVLQVFDHKPKYCTNWNFDPMMVLDEILGGPQRYYTWMCVPNVMGVHSTVDEPFQCRGKSQGCLIVVETFQSGPQRWTRLSSTEPRCWLIALYCVSVCAIVSTLSHRDNSDADIE